MQGIAEFHKVSFKQFAEDIRKCGFADDEVTDEQIRLQYDAIKLPQRATSGSAGYDFYTPYPFHLRYGSCLTIPTGICVDMQPGWCLVLMPRSGLGNKFGMRLKGTLGLIDFDYIFAENEGHIYATIIADQNICLGNGDRFMQGVFLPFGLTKDDSADGVRVGGHGSTGV